MADSVAAKVRLLFELCKSLGRKIVQGERKSINLFNCFSEPQPILCKSEDLTDVFNSCWVLGRAECGVYKPKWRPVRLEHGASGSAGVPPAACRDSIHRSLAIF